MSSFVCSQEYVVDGVSVDYASYCEYQKTLKRSERYYYCQSPMCGQGFSGKGNQRTIIYCSRECSFAHKKYISEQSIIDYNNNPNLCKNAFILK